jgi:CDP-diacylglycerol--serine O-phosphatidyltransferase
MRVEFLEGLLNLAWMPNTLTFGNLTCGFVSIVFASHGTLQGNKVAALLVLLAALLDGLDGQVARWVRVSSPIGKELDSLADCVTFGVAPGYLAYKAYLCGTGFMFGERVFDIGIAIAAVFPICAAYRLARFNVQSVPGSFSGLPSPIAAILVALVPLSFPYLDIPRAVFAVGFCVVALLMVSTVRYSKPQSTFFKNFHGVRLALFFILVVLLLVLFRFRIVLLFAGLYVVSGLVGYVIHFIEDRRY